MAEEGGAGGYLEVVVVGVNLDIWPPIVQQVRGQLAQTGLSRLAFPPETPHPSAEFLLVTKKQNVIRVMP